MMTAIKATRWQDVDMSNWPWSNFEPPEMASKGDGSIYLCRDAMDKLQALRDVAGVPLIITSAYRDPEHNKRVGGAKESYHMRGMAFDIRVDNIDPSRLIAEARKLGFNGVGTYPRQGFVHIDTRATDAQWGQPFAERETRFAPETAPLPSPKDRATPAASRTLQAAGIGGFATVATAAEAAFSADWRTVAVLALVAVALAVVMRERLKAWAAGWR